MHPQFFPAALRAAGFLVACALLCGIVETMFWAEQKADEVRERFATLAKQGGPIIVRDEKTLSGRVHVGSMRGVAIHGIVTEILKNQSFPVVFKYELNDFDPMDGLPVYLDQEKFKQYMGLPLNRVPSPDASAPNFAEFYGKEFTSVIENAGFYPEYYRASELYCSGRMNDAIRKALLNADLIRDIYKRVSGSQKEDKWLPINVICEQCGKVTTTRSTVFDGEKVTYSCVVDAVDYTKGCGYSGSVSPFDGRAKLPWKVEWAAKWGVVGVHVEGAGKDHSTKGGSRDVANHIAREVFGFTPPFDIPYEFFLVGGKKMSSSKGKGSSSKEVADLLPPHLFRLALLQKNIKQAIDFDPEGDTIPVLFDTYDRLAEKYYQGIEDDHVRLFVLSHIPAAQSDIRKRYLPRFSLVAFLVQMPHLDFMTEIEKLKGATLTADDREEAEMRARYAKQWLAQYAPEQFKFILQTESLPEAVSGFSPEQRTALGAIADFLAAHEKPTGEELHAALHDIKEKSGLTPQQFFSSIYQSFLGKDSGPQAGWFLSALPRDFLLKRLAEVRG